MATVYLAQDLKHHRPVAIKVLNPELAGALGPERFLREIEIAARLNHPHILALIDSGEADGFLYYVMPYVEGESLRERLKREGQLPLEEALRIAREVASALSHAHSHDVVHRDIKPENILISGGEAVVADFGIGRAITAAARDTLTGTGIAIGTPGYMSPEQATGGARLDGRSDIYSLACVLYEMLAGDPPYVASSSEAILARQSMDPVPRLRTVRETVPAAVEQVIGQALSKVPADRFATAAAFAEALQAAMRTAASPAAAHRAPAWRVVAVVAVVVLLVGAFGVWRWRHGRPATADAVRLAVLPFENLGDPTRGYFADGMTDEVRGKLASLAGLQVIASTSSNQYRHTIKHPEEIGRELGVRYLLLGRVRWTQSARGVRRVRVDPELMQVADVAAPIIRWEQSFDAPLTDVFEMQTNIAGKVADRLQLALTPAAQQALAQRPTASLAAYDAFLKGEAASQGTSAFDLSSLRRAIGYYEQAVTLDSAFALAWARLAQARAFAYGMLGNLPADARAARVAVERAQALAPGSPNVQLALGIYQQQVPNDLLRALEADRVGLERAPANADLLSSAAVAEVGLGRCGAACWPRSTRCGVTKHGPGPTPTRRGSRSKRGSGPRQATPGSTSRWASRWPLWDGGQMRYARPSTAWRCCRLARTHTLGPTSTINSRGSTYSRESRRRRWTSLSGCYRSPTTSPPAGYGSIPTSRYCAGIRGSSGCSCRSSRLSNGSGSDEPFLVEV